MATKAKDAFTKIYRECTGKYLRVKTEKLEQLKNDIKQYRNLLHEPMPGTVKDGHGTRLIPRRNMIEKYALWTSAMYHRDASDFIPVEVQLNSDFERVAGVLQDLWTQLEEASEKLAKNRDYLRRRSAGKASTTE